MSTASVLFVDDEPAVTEAISAALRSEPFTVLTANSAESGLELLRSQRIDVVVSDECMPGVSGAAFLATVRAEFPSTGRVILTGQASVEATIAAVNDAHVFQVLTKPCPVATIVQCINDALASAPSVLEDSSETAARHFDEALASLHMVYQPIYAWGTKRIFAYEALMRAEHDHIANPGDLIDIAVRIGRHCELDDRVCRLVAADADSAPSDVLLFINLLPETISDDRLQEVTAAVGRFAGRVGLEVTERARIAPTIDLEAKLAALRHEGFRVVLDDLGAGYAGLTSFAALRPDVVKLDMELLRDIHRSPTRSRLVLSLLDLCGDLDVPVVAEGVETMSELRHLSGLGCDLFQGFGVARPAGPWIEVGADVSSDSGPTATSIHDRPTSAPDESAH